MKIEFETTGIQRFAEYCERLPAVADHAAQLAINDAARFAIRRGSKQMREEINFPARYLVGADGRLKIVKHATHTTHEAVVRGRDRATSLARFAKTPVRFGRQKGITVKVDAKGSTRLRRGFYMKLRRGRTFEGGNHNVGLAVRLKPGESLSKSQRALELGGGVWLLYGPSVDQVFKGVAVDILDEVSEKLNSEFQRQFDRLSAK